MFKKSLLLVVILCSQCAVTRGAADAYLSKAEQKLELEKLEKERKELKLKELNLKHQQLLSLWEEEAQQQLKLYLEKVPTNKKALFRDCCTKYSNKYNAQAALIVDNAIKADDKPCINTLTVYGGPEFFDSRSIKRSLVGFSYNANAHTIDPEHLEAFVNHAQHDDANLPLLDMTKTTQCASTAPLFVNEKIRANHRKELCKAAFISTIISSASLDLMGDTFPECMCGTQYSAIETEKQKQALKEKIQSATQSALNSPHTLAFLKYAQQNADLDRFDTITSENDSSTPKNAPDQSKTPALNEASNAFTKAPTAPDIWPTNT